ncbi:hypothetical protein GY45DRAFT_1366798 [Cubamyces sp. BRFM 1775]|nr:hypothetical protein GY45DRAFT_1366798 [Cubamyces sp. BRFM 1775]
MSSVNVTGPPAGVFTSSASPSDVASSSVVSPSSALGSSSFVSSSLASGSSIFTAQSGSASIPAASPSLSDSATQLSSASASHATRTSVASPSVITASTLASSFSSPLPRTTPIDVPVPAPPASSVFVATSTFSSSAVTASTAVSLRASSTPSVLTSSVDIRSLPNPATPPSASTARSTQAEPGSSTVVNEAHTSIVATRTSLQMAEHTQADTQSSASPQASASVSGSAASQISSPAPSGTDDGRDPALPQSSQSGSASSAASKPASSPSPPASTSLAPTSSPSGSASASASNSHSVATQHPVSSGSPESSPTPTKSPDTGSSPSPTSSLHAVSSPSSPAPASHDHTQPTSVIPPGFTVVAPVVHSTIPASRSSQALGSPGAASHSSESEPALTPPAQNDVSGHATASASNGPAPEVQPSPSPAQPAPISSLASGSSPHDIKNTSGMVQANANSAPPTSTSTVTDQPETTLSSPVFVTVTDAKHHTSLSVPPIFTSVIVSQLPDGQQVSVTHVIANPTGIYGVEIDSSHGFFSNSGVVAGVFLVVGIVITAGFVGICLFLRRRRRNPRFIDTISRPLPMPDNPFEDPRDLPAPQMRYASGYTDRTLIIDSGAANRDGTRPQRSPFDDDMAPAALNRPPSSRSASRYNGLGLAGIGAHGRSGSTDSSRSSAASRSRSRHTSGQSGGIGLAITSDFAQGANVRERRPDAPPPSAQSSPSIYPPTLPNEDDEGVLVDVPLNRHHNSSSPSIHSVARKPVPSPDLISGAPSPIPASPAPVVSPTPRTPQAAARPPVIPPRSPLRRNSMTATQPLSPPPYKRPPITLDTRIVPPPIARNDTAGTSATSATSGSSEMESIALRPYEPLTPPTSLSSLTPPGSSVGHDSPNSPSDKPGSFMDMRDSVVGSPGLGPMAPQLPAMTPMNPRKDTFYSRRNGSQRRPSVEWKN